LRNAKAKTHFVIIDPLGLCAHTLVEAPPLDRNRNIAFERLIEAVGFGSTDPMILSTLASRLTRLDRQLSHADQETIKEQTGGTTLSDIVRALANSVDPDVQLDEAKVEHAVEDPTPEQIATTAERLKKEAAKPLLAPKLRNLLTSLKSSYEQTIDSVSQDTLLHAGFSGDSQDKARETAQSFRQFLEENKDQIAALQILYSRPWKNRLTFKQVKELAAAIQRPHPAWTPENLWRAYEQLDRSKVKGSGQRVMTDLVSLVSFAIGTEPDLRPYPDKVREQFQVWLSEQQQMGANFTDEQMRWLHHIAEHIATSLEIRTEDFDYVPFSEQGGLGRAYQVFGFKEVLVPRSVLVHYANQFGSKWDQLAAELLANLMAAVHAEQQTVVYAAYEGGLITEDLANQYRQYDCASILRSLTSHALDTVTFLRQQAELSPRWIAPNRSTTVGPRSIRQTLTDRFRSLLHEEAAA